MTFAGRRILVVEDEFLVSITTVDFLESIGCTVVGPAVCVAAAVQIAQSETLDAAILDIDLAGEMVWPVAEELRRKTVPFMFLSAQSRLIAFPALLAVAPRLDKPLEQDRLLRLLNAVWAAAPSVQLSAH